MCAVGLCVSWMHDGVVENTASLQNLFSSNVTLFPFSLFFISKIVLYNECWNGPRVFYGFWGFDFAVSSNYVPSYINSNLQVLSEYTKWRMFNACTVLCLHYRQFPNFPAWLTPTPPDFNGKLLLNCSAYAIQTINDKRQSMNRNDWMITVCHTIFMPTHTHTHTIYTWTHTPKCVRLMRQAWHFCS